MEEAWLTQIKQIQPPEESRRIAYPHAEQIKTKEPLIIRLT